LLLFASSMLLPAAGLQAIPYVALLFVLDYTLRRRLCVADLRAVATGCIAGGSAMAVVFLWNHALTAYVSQTIASGYNMVGAGLQVAVINDDAAVGRLMAQLKALSPLSVLQIIIQDMSVLPLMVFLLAIALSPWHRNDPALRRAALGGCIAAVLIPWGMLASGRYAFYYAWMAAIPVAIAFVVALERCWLTRQRALATCGALAATISIVLGMPLEISREVHKVGAGGYAAVERIVRDETRPGDALYGDPVLYYAARRAAVEFISTSYAGGRGYRTMTDDERATISVAIVAPEHAIETFEKLGGTWRQTRTYQSPYGPVLTVYRRTGVQTSINQSVSASCVPGTQERGSLPICGSR